MSSTHAMLLLLPILSISAALTANVGNRADDLLQVQHFELPIDHFNSDAGSFRNRWWFNDTYYTPGGPVIIYDAGEESGELFTSMLRETSQRTSVMQLAQKYHGIGVVWEHRYFGESVPFVQDNTVSNRSFLNADQWSYHTFEQALEDVVFFANKFVLPSNAFAASKTPDALHASKTPFIFIGEGYGGTRASTLRIRNPETIFASWSSSASVQVAEFSPFRFRAIARALPHNCSADVTTGVKYFDSIMSGGNATLKSQIKNQLYSVATNKAVDVTTTDALEDGVVAQQLLQPFLLFDSVGPQVVQPFCDILETQGSRIKSSSEGLASSVSPDDIYASILLGIKTVHFGNPLSSYSSLSDLGQGSAKHIITSCEVTQSTLFGDQLAASWLTCTQLSNYPMADLSASINFVSTSITAATLRAQCNTIFPNLFSASRVVDGANAKYGGWSQNPSRVMYTHGELDSGIVFSVASSEDSAPRRTAANQVPSADRSPANDTFYGILYAGQVYAVDLVESPNHTIPMAAARTTAFESGLAMFGAALDEWLPAFKPGSEPVLSTATGTVTGTAAIPSETGGGDPKQNGAFDYSMDHHAVFLLVFALFSGIGPSFL